MKEKWKTIHESYQRSPDGEDLLYDVDEGKGFEKYCDLCPAKIIQSLMEEAMSMGFNPQNFFLYTFPEEVLVRFLLCSATYW